MPIRKITAGHYEGPRGVARNVTSASGAPHTRQASLWLVTYSDGKTTMTRSFRVARELISAPLRERLCTPMTIGEAAIAASTVC
jgi:hypothetical protein